ncbi:related to ARG82-dual-specificity inositol polyphosphate kinase required for regulation of phosphate-and nitrogen-responsive genes [Sporisorium reilianum SRZ2]|uniref:Kinase n=1 Tax=Sporisorium reilianum (strain SRZ2) TaxID=999809 RepID=E6ZQ70_SPORE|nr:related to ARG82-dual-specificity inositol polyphosphate kinase required for regulation of phosphate-and nitrogen-responsive genes [Sporisorium reilianum SRZ2]
MTDASIPAAEPELTPLGNQVAGHPDGVQSLQGGRLVVKACLPRELGFYKEVEQAAAGKAGLEARQMELLGRLLKTMPGCHGSWEEYTGRRSETETTGDDGAAPRIVMENLTFGYDKPNVCDIKLGTQLWDEEASEEKRQRMDKAAANTTSGSHGIRLTGWQTYDAKTDTFHSVPKTFGKTIKPEHLGLGMRMLLACPEHGDAEQAEAVLPGTSIKSEDGSQNRLACLPEELVGKLLRNHLIKDLEELHAIFSEVEVRMRGASLLLVYEGESTRLEQTLALEGSGGRQPGRPQVRLIDFGHATLVPGQGADQGVLLGLSTTLDLARRTLENLEQRQKQ